MTEGMTSERTDCMYLATLGEMEAKQETEKQPSTGARYI